MSTIERPSEERVKRLGPRLALLVCLTVIAWGPSLRFDAWAADDVEVVLESPVVTGALPMSAAFDRDYTHHVGGSGQWRPAASISLRCDHSLHGPNSSFGWHLTNLLLHVAAVALAALLAFRARGELFMLGVAVYAIHPALSDSVAWISGRPSLICAFLGLTGAHLLQWAISTRRGAPCITMCALAAALLPLLAKEDGVAFAALLLLLSLPGGPSAVRATALGCCLAIFVWLIARASALGIAFPTATHSILEGAPLQERLLVGLRASAEAIRLIWSPVDRPPHYEISGLPGPTLSALLVGAVVALLMVARKVRPIPVAFIVLPALAFVPFLQIIPAGEPFAPRFMHVPLLLSIPLADELLRRIKTPLMCALLVAFLVTTWRSIPSYADAESYWTATLRHSSESPTAWNALGIARADEGRHEEAVESFRTSLSQDPGHSRAWSNLARSLHAMGKEGEAIAALESAVRVGPDNPIAHINWGLHMERSGEFEAARSAFLRGVHLRPGHLTGWDGLARVCANLGRAVEAAAAEERARSLRQR